MYGFPYDLYMVFNFIWLIFSVLYSIPGRYESFWKELDYVKHLWKNRQELKVEDAGIAALFGLECFAWFCAGEIVGRGFTFTGYHVWESPPFKGFVFVSFSCYFRDPNHGNPASKFLKLRSQLESVVALIIHAFEVNSYAPCCFIVIFVGSYCCFWWKNDNTALVLICCFTSTLIQFSVLAFTKPNFYTWCFAVVCGGSEDSLVYLRIAFLKAWQLTVFFAEYDLSVLLKWREFISWFRFCFVASNDN
jgi:hypothetical protein